jgi:integrase
MSLTLPRITMVSGGPDIVWNAVYDAAVQELKDAMDLAYLTGQRPAEVLKVTTTDLNAEFLMVKQGKTAKKLRLRLEDEGVQSGLSAFINDLQGRSPRESCRQSRRRWRLCPGSADPPVPVQ